MNPLQKNQQWSQIINLAEPYAPLAPDDTFAMSLLTSAYQQTKGYAKFVVFGEKVYARQPSGNLAYYLAKAYQELGNDQKFTFWGEKTVAQMPDNHEILVELTRKFAQAKRNAEAGKYAGLCVKAMEQAAKPEGHADDDVGSSTRADRSRPATRSSETWLTRRTITRAPSPTWKSPSGTSSATTSPTTIWACRTGSRTRSTSRC